MTKILFRSFWCWKFSFIKLSLQWLVRRVCNCFPFLCIWILFLFFTVYIISLSVHLYLSFFNHVHCFISLVYTFGFCDFAFVYLLLNIFRLKQNLYMHLNDCSSLISYTTYHTWNLYRIPYIILLRGTVFHLSRLWPLG